MSGAGVGRAIAFASLLGLAIASPAQAVLTVDLVWVATTGSGTTGFSRIEAEPGDMLTLEIAIIVDEAGVEGYTLSVEFDADLGDELDFVSAEEFDNVPTNACDPIPNCLLPPKLTNLTMGIGTVIESTPSQPGLVPSFEATTAANDGPASFRSPIGEIIFLVTPNVSADGIDLEGSILTAVDGYIDNDSIDIGIDDLPDPAFEPGFAPEPTTGSLGLAALATLAWLRSRRTRWTRQSGCV